MTEIQLAGGAVCFVDAEDLPLVEGFAWRLFVNNGHKYAAAGSGKGLRLMHRVLMSPTPEQSVDHINGDGLNNCRSNLRVCSHAENMRNRKVGKNNRLGVKNIHLDRQKSKSPFFRVEISLDGRKHRASFKTLEAAKEYAASLRRQLHGEFACDGFRHETNSFPAH